MRTRFRSVRLTGLDSGTTAAERDTDHRLRRSMRLRKPSTAASTEEGNSSAKGGFEMKPGFLSAAESVVDPRQFQPDAGQLRPFRQDSLEPAGGLSQEVQPHFDETQQEQPLDALVFICRLRPFQDLAGFLQPARIEEEAPRPPRSRFRCVAQCAGLRVPPHDCTASLAASTERRAKIPMARKKGQRHGCGTTRDAATATSLPSCLRKNRRTALYSRCWQPP